MKPAPDSLETCLTSLVKNNHPILKYHSSWTKSNTFYPHLVLTEPHDSTSIIWNSLVPKCQTLNFPSDPYFELLTVNLALPLNLLFNFIQTSRSNFSLLYNHSFMSDSLIFVRPNSFIHFLIKGLFKTYSMQILQKNIPVVPDLRVYNLVSLSFLPSQIPKKRFNYSFTSIQNFIDYLPYSNSTVQLVPQI